MCTARLVGVCARRKPGNYLDQVLCLLRCPRPVTPGRFPLLSVAAVGLDPAPGWRGTFDGATRMQM
jgi:hypothetical protein